MHLLSTLVDQYLTGFFMRITYITSDDDPNCCTRVQLIFSKPFLLATLGIYEK